MSILAISAKIPAIYTNIKVKKLLSIITVWKKRAQMRHKLAQLPEYRLVDMGINPEEARIESQKSFWEE